MRFLIPLAAALTAAAPQAPEPDPAARAAAAAVAPFVGEETLAVARLDLARLDARALVGRVAGELADEEDVRAGTAAVGAWADRLKGAGVKDLFVLVEPADLPGLPVAVVPLGAEGDAQAVAAALTAGGPVRWPAAETVRGAVVAGTPAALARARAAVPSDRPELAAALAAGGRAAASVVLVPSATLRRAVEESVADLPSALGGGPVTDLTRGMRWASLALTDGPAPALRLVAQARDADAAAALRRVARGSLEALAARSRDDRRLAPLAPALDRLTPEVRGDRLTLEADLTKAAALAAMPIREARERARRSQCTNNLKQIGLAFHNYHSAHNTFPAAFTAARDGTPLLSWRVLILPFLGEQALYDAFHRDEPWDSPHNKALISRMPATFACPGAGRRLAPEGKTSYLAPRGPATMVPGARGVKVQDVTDGTSNTILVVDAGDDAAVVWTRPEDWDVAAAPDAAPLVGHHPGGFQALFGDGSVRFLRAAIKPALLKALTTRNGSEVISADDF
jgi:hypothetical protein